MGPDNARFSPSFVAGSERPTLCPLRVITDMWFPSVVRTTADSYVESCPAHRLQQTLAIIRNAANRVVVEFLEEPVGVLAVAHERHLERARRHAPFKRWHRGRQSSSQHSRVLFGIRIGMLVGAVVLSPTSDAFAQTDADMAFEEWRDRMKTPTWSLCALRTCASSSARHRRPVRFVNQPPVVSRSCPSNFFKLMFRLIHARTMRASWCMSHRSL